MSAANLSANGSTVGFADSHWLEPMLGGYNVFSR